MQIFNSCSLSYSIGVLWCKICRHCRLRRITGFRDQNVRQYYEQQSLSTLILILLLVGSLSIQIILSLINVSCQLLVAHLTHNNSHKNGCKSRMRICKLTNIIALIVLMIIGLPRMTSPRTARIIFFLRAWNYPNYQKRCQLMLNFQCLALVVCCLPQLFCPSCHLR